MFSKKGIQPNPTGNLVEDSTAVRFQICTGNLVEDSTAVRFQIFNGVNLYRCKSFSFTPAIRNKITQQKINGNKIRQSLSNTQPKNSCLLQKVYEIFTGNFGELLLRRFGYTQRSSIGFGGFPDFISIYFLLHYFVTMRANKIILLFLQTHKIRKCAKP